MPASIASRRRATWPSASIPRCRPPTARRSAIRGSASSRTGTSAAFTSFGDGHGVWESGGGPQLPFYCRNFPEVRAVAVARSTLADLMPRIVALEQKNFTALPPGAGTPRRLTSRRTRCSRTAWICSARCRRQAPAWSGRACARASRSPARGARQRRRARRSTIVQVTNLGIDGQGQPAVDARLRHAARQRPAGRRRARLDHQHREQAALAGTTGDDGIAMAPALPLRKPDDWYELSFVVTAEKDGDVAYVGVRLERGHPAVGLRPQLRAVGSDRHPARLGLHRPRRLQAGRGRPRQGHRPRRHAERHAAAAGRDGARRQVTDSRNREVDRRTRHGESTGAASNGRGRSRPRRRSATTRSRRRVPGRTASRTRPTRTERRAEGDWLKQVGGSFLVAAYRRPDFRVDTTLTQPTPVAGAPLRGAVERAVSVRRRHGAPAGALVADARARTLRSRPRFSRSSRATVCLRLLPGRRATAAPKRVAGDTAALDADGSSRSTSPSTATRDFAHRYTFEGDVEDVSRQHIANRATVVVHPGAVVHRLAPTGRTSPTPPPAPASTSSPSICRAMRCAGVPITVTLTRIQWNSVRRAEGSGFYTWDTERSARCHAGEWTGDVRGDADTRADSRARGRLLRHRARRPATATAGGRAPTRAFYALGTGYTAWERFDHNRITLEPERKTWKPGETARMMIQSPWETRDGAPDRRA